MGARAKMAWVIWFHRIGHGNAATEQIERGTQSDGEQTKTESTHLMTTMTVWESFAKILDYPENRADSVVAGCIAGLGIENAAAASLLRNFRDLQNTMTPGQLQELYTGTFDMVPECSLYLGYQLFGDDWRRSSFLADLAGRYQASGLSVGKELPDHLCLILRFLAKEGAEGEHAPLIQDCLVPALTRVLKAIDDKTNLYGLALEAFLAWLRTFSGSQPSTAKSTNAGS